MVRLYGPNNSLLVLKGLKEVVFITGAPRATPLLASKLVLKVLVLPIVSTLRVVVKLLRSLLFHTVRVPDPPLGQTLRAWVVMRIGVVLVSTMGGAYDYPVGICIN